MYSDTLNDKEVKRLGELGQVIQGCLSCDINDNNIPCRTDRLQAVNHMIGYLSIHGYKITRSSNEVFEYFITIESNDIIFWGDRAMKRI